MMKSRHAGSFLNCVLPEYIYTSIHLYIINKYILFFESHHQREREKREKR